MRATCEIDSNRIDGGLFIADPNMSTGKRWNFVEESGCSIVVEGGLFVERTVDFEMWLYV